MNPIEGITYGLGIALTAPNLLAAFIGALAGTAIGVLPGLGPSAGAALLLPLTFTLEPLTSIIMIAGIYFGAMYGGSTTSVLLNMPGEAASVVTAIDGYQLTQKGRARPVLAIMAVGSFIAGTASVVLVMLFSPLLANFALLFGPAEFFALTAGGLLVLARISGGTLASGLLPMAIGLMLATVGQEAVTGRNRFTFGSLTLTQGINFIPVIVGLYGIAEIMVLAESDRSAIRAHTVRLRDLFPSREEWRRSFAPWGRGTIVGFLFGLLPGPSAMLSSFASYRLEKSVSKHKKEIGGGAIEGVAGPEAANNAAATAGLVPVLSLGIPFSVTLAVMLAAMIIQGVQPGPLLISQRPDIFWGLVAAMYIGNIMLVILNLPLVGIWIQLLRTPFHILVPLILLFSVIGAYSARNSMLDVYVLVVLGVLGYFLRKLEFQLAPLIVGMVLGTQIEKHLRESLFLSQGDPSIYVSTPLALGIWLVVLLVSAVGASAWIHRRLFGTARPAAQPDSDV